MYSRRTSSSNPLRWFIGALIIIGAVGGFFVFQASQPTPPTGPIPTPTPLPGTKAVILPTATTRSTTYRIISEKAKLSTEITKLYYSLKEDNWDLTYLGALAGHLEGTPEIGQGGNFVLAGHVELRDGGKGPFAEVTRLSPGDPISILGDQRPNPVVYQYIVTEVKKVKPQEFGVMRNHGFEELTLITCDDWDQRTQLYDSRIIVHARPAAAMLRLTGTPQSRTAAPATLVQRFTATPTPRR
jgi:LPXTG-site transpeptidase (sortase) family protein